MNLSPLSLKYIPLSYETAIIKLQNEVNAAPTFEAQSKIFQNFTKKYTTRPSIWRDWLKYVCFKLPKYELIFFKLCDPNFA